MLNQDVNITFDYDYGIYQLELNCNWVKFGLEFVGEVEEDIDFDLVEDYDDVRLLISLRVKCSLPEALFMANFLSSTKKRLIIDGMTIDVVNDMSKKIFDLWFNSNIKSDLELNFKGKSIGLPDWSEGDFGSLGHLGNSIGVES